MRSVYFLLLNILLHWELQIDAKISSTEQLTKTRIISEWRDINKDNLTLNTPFDLNSIDECDIRISPIKKNFLQWHFSFRGVKNSSFEEGCYHGRILLDKDYPRKAPSICMLTPNGRWEVGKEICLSASSYHQETWDMKWNLRTLVMALRGHMLTQPREIGAISSTPDRHRILAKLSRYYQCKHCQASHQYLLSEEESPVDSISSSQSLSLLSSRNVMSRELTKKMKKIKLKNGELSGNGNYQKDLKMADALSSKTSEANSLVKLALLMIPIVIMLFSRFISQRPIDFGFTLQFF